MRLPREQEGAHPDMHVVEERTILPYEYHSDGFYMCLLEKDV